MDPSYVFLISLLALLLLVCFGLWFYYWLPKFRFWLTFGLWPEQEFDEKRIVQEQVEVVLGRLVFPFLAFCFDEQKITEIYRGYNGRSERMPKKDMKRLKEIRGKLERAKYAFYAAKKLAKKFDFAVCDDAKTYLDSEEKARLNLNQSIAY